MQAAYDHEMEDDSETRLGPRKLRRARRLARLVEEQGGNQGAIGAAVGIQKSNMSHLVAGKKGLGDELADRLEAEYGYPNGWLDWPDEALAASVSTLQPPRASLLSSMHRLREALQAVSEQDRESAAAMLQVLARNPQDSRKADIIIDILTPPSASAAASGE